MVRPPAIPPHVEEEFVLDWVRGMVGRDLAAKYGCSTGAVSTTAKRLGLTPRKAGPPRIQSVSGHQPSPEPSPARNALRGGEWVSNGRVMVWQPNTRDR